MKYEPEKSEWRKELSDLWEEFPLKEELLDKVGTLLRTHFIPKEQVRSELNRLDTEVLPTHAEEMRDSIKEVSHDAFELGIRTERNRILRALIDIDFPPGMWGRISYIIAPTSPTETEV